MAIASPTPDLKHAAIGPHMTELGFPLMPTNFVWCAVHESLPIVLFKVWVDEQGITEHGQQYVELQSPAFKPSAKHLWNLRGLHLDLVKTGHLAFCVFQQKIAISDGTGLQGAFDANWVFRIDELMEVDGKTVGVLGNRYSVAEFKRLYPRG